MISSTDTSRAGVRANLEAIMARIEAAKKAALAPAKDVRLIAVSKGHEAETVRLALAAGHRLFGENRVQEAREKWPALKANFPNTELHLIGPLQTNKVANCIGFFDAIHSLDREKLARTLADALTERRVALSLFVQVNTGAEPQKAGIAPDTVGDFVRYCRDDLHLPILGLMCIPPVSDEPGPHFAFLSELAMRCGLAELSMGMSGDFETAIHFGASYVRVGTAIFGERLKPAR